MLDNSWSIGRTNYFFQKEFLYKFIERIDTDKVHVSAVSYSSYPKAEFYFKDRALYASPKNRRKKILSRLKWRGGETGNGGVHSQRVLSIFYTVDTVLKNSGGLWNAYLRQALSGGRARENWHLKL